MLSWTDNRIQHNIAHIQTAQYDRCMFQLDSPMDKMFPLGKNGQWGMVLLTLLHSVGQGFWIPLDKRTQDHKVQRHSCGQALHNNDLLCNSDTHFHFSGIAHQRKCLWDIPLVLLCQQDSSGPPDTVLNLDLHQVWLIQHYDGRSSQLHTAHLQLLHFHEHRICQSHRVDNLEQEIVILYLSTCLHLGCVDFKITYSMPSFSNSCHNKRSLAFVHHLQEYYSKKDQLTAGSIALVSEKYIGVAGHGFKSHLYLILFRLYTRNCPCCVHNCDDLYLSRHSNVCLLYPLAQHRRYSKI